MVINKLTPQESDKLIEYLSDLILSLGWKVIIPKDADVNEVHGIMMGDAHFIDAWRKREQIKNKELQ